MWMLEIIVRRRVTTTVIVLIAIILGLLSYVSLPVRKFPDVEFPMATVTTVYSGGSPEEIETEISKPIEDAVSSISGIDEIRSYSQQGMSLVMVMFDLENDIDIKAMDIRDNIDQIRRQLPDGAEDPVVGKFDFSQRPVVTIALTGPQSVDELYRLADERLQDRLAQVSGVAEVQLTGGREREIHVLLNPVKLRSYGISVNQVAAAIRGANEDVPAGQIIQPAMEYTVRTKGRFQTVEQMKNVPVVKRNDGTVYVRHLGTVKDTYEVERTRSRADGRRSIILSVLKQSDANDVEISEGVKNALPELREMLPVGARMEVMQDTSNFVRGALSNVRQNIVLGIVITVFVLYLFLGSLRGTLIAVVVMPSALIITLCMMLFSDITLNILTLTALALSMGIVVNNAILILENAHRFVERGFEPVDAAIRGTADIGLAIISSTATNLVVFLPIAFMGEIIGRFFREFGLTIVYVTTVSLFVSFTLTPMMCGALLKADEGAGGDDSWWGLCRSVVLAPYWLWIRFFGWIQDRYVELVGWCVRWRKTTMLVTGGLVALSLAGIGVVIGAEMFPASDEGRFEVSVETKVGSSLDFTSDRVKEVEEVIAENISEDYLKHYYSRIGQVSGFMGSSSQGTHLAEIGGSLVAKGERSLTVRQILNDLRPELAEVPSVKLTATSEGGAGGEGAPIQVEVRGNDMQVLQDVTGEVIDIVEKTDGTSDVGQSYRTGKPEIQLDPIMHEVGRHQLTIEQLGGTVRTYIEGREVTQFRDRGEDYDIRMKLQERYRRWSDDIHAMFAYSPETEQMLQMGQVADWDFQAGPTVITRKDRRRLITVTAQLTGERKVGPIKKEIDRKIGRELTLPEGVDITYGGEAEMMRKNFPEIYQAMITAGVLTFLCVAGIIESFLYGTLILISIPICAIGVCIAMLIGGVSLNIFSLMAMVMLVGMVVNNAIVILDYAMREERMDMPPAERVVQACKVRFRVVIMANLTTVLAMVPLSLGLGFAGEIFQPIAVVEMGGVFAAASLSILVIPAIYTAVENVRGAG